MKPDALLINTARGALVDGYALAAGAEGAAARRRRNRRAAAGAAGRGRPPARSRHSQSDRHAAHRLGGPRGAPALPRRNGRQHRRIFCAAGGAGGWSDRPARACAAASLSPLRCRFFALLLRRALLFQRLGRLLLFFFLSFHALAHDCAPRVLTKTSINRFAGRAAQQFALGVAGRRGFRRRLGRLLGDLADPQLAARHPHLLQRLEYLLRHAFRQVDEAVVLADVDPPDVHALDARLVGDRADDVARLDAVYRPHFDAKSFHVPAAARGRSRRARRSTARGAAGACGRYAARGGAWARAGSACGGSPRPAAAPVRRLHRVRRMRRFAAPAAAASRPAQARERGGDVDERQPGLRLQLLQDRPERRSPRPWRRSRRPAA